MHEEVVDGVEVVAEIVVENRGAFVRHRIEGSQANALLYTADAVVPAGCTPVDEAVVKGAAIWSVDWWVGEVF